MDAIVQEAHALVHEGGASALSMRPLAAALGTSTSALYRRLPSKEWLYVAIVDHVLEDVVTTPPDARAGARRRLEGLSASLRGVLSAHPHLHEVLVSHVAVTPNTIRIAEAAFSALRDLGVGDDELIDAYNAWCGYVIGFTVIETKPPDLAPDAELQATMRSLLKRTNGPEHPTVAELMPRVANLSFGLRWRPGRLGSTQASFDWGLRALLDGFKDTRRGPLRG